MGFKSLGTAASALQLSLQSNQTQRSCFCLRFHSGFGYIFMYTLCSLCLIGFTFIFFPVLGIEPKAWYMFGRHSIGELCPRWWIWSSWTLICLYFLSCSHRLCSAFLPWQEKIAQLRWELMMKTKEHTRKLHQMNDLRIEKKKLDSRLNTLQNQQVCPFPSGKFAEPRVLHSAGI